MPFLSPPLAWQQMALVLAEQISPVTGVERINLHKAAGRTLSAAIIAANAIPTFDHAVMDGFAIGGETTGHYKITGNNLESLSVGDARQVSAGIRVPLNTKAVVLAHNVDVSGDQVVVRHQPRRDNIRKQGEEAKPGDSLVMAGTRLDARHLALAGAAGITEIDVRRQPRIALLGLQDEKHQLPHLGVLAAMLTSSSLHLTLVGVTSTGDLQRLLTQLARSHDLVVVVAESLRGEDGALFQTIQTAGSAAKVWRANLKPAKPVISGKVGIAQIIGLAGTAYATATAAHLFLRPVLQRLLDMPVHHQIQPAMADFARSKEGGRAEALPVGLQYNGAVPQLTLAGRFGQLRALAAMDGMALIEAEQGDITPGTPLSFMPVQIPLI